MAHETKSKKKRKFVDKVGKGTDAADFDKGATSGAPSVSQVAKNIKGSFTDLFSKRKQNPTKKKLNKARRK